jgi:uncharacterized FAD-dependent dehydrogenase
LSACTNVGAMLPRVVADSIRAAPKHFARRIEWFMSPDGAGFRTGSPVRIGRGESGAGPHRRSCAPAAGESVSAENLYPAGPGAGHAGGIVSLAADSLHWAARAIGRSARPR